MAKGNAAALLGAGSIFAALGGAYKFGEFAQRVKKLHDVGPHNSVFIRLIQRVRRDLDEVQRLLALPEIKDQLSRNREKTEWIYGVVKDTRGALEEILPHTERVDSDLRDGRRVGFRHRLRWLLDEKDKLQTRELELNTAHLSLIQVLSFLTALEPLERRGGRHDTRVDIEIERDGPQTIEERYLEREHRGPRTVEERYVEEREFRGPRRVEERYVEEDTQFRGAGRFHEGGQHGGHLEVQGRFDGPGRHQESHFEEYEQDRQRGPERYEERRFEERDYRGPGGRVEERRYEEERGPGRYEERLYEEYRGTRDPRFQQYRAGRNDQIGDPGFGDFEVHNPRIGPELERETWVEERVDSNVDQYGNKLVPESLRTGAYDWRYTKRSRL